MVPLLYPCKCRVLDDTFSLLQEIPEREGVERYICRVIDKWLVLGKEKNDKDWRESRS